MTPSHCARSPAQRGCAKKAERRPSADPAAAQAPNTACVTAHWKDESSNRDEPSWAGVATSTARLGDPAGSRTGSYDRRAGYSCCSFLPWRRHTISWLLTTNRVDRSLVGL